MCYQYLSNRGHKLVNFFFTSKKCNVVLNWKKTAIKFFFNALLIAMILHRHATLFIVIILELKFTEAETAV